MKYRIIKYANGKYGLQYKWWFWWMYVKDLQGLIIEYETSEEAEKGLRLIDDPHRVVEIIKTEKI